MYESLGWWVVCGTFDNRWVCRKGWWLVVHGSQCICFGGVLTSNVYINIAMLIMRRLEFACWEGKVGHGSFVLFFFVRVFAMSNKFLLC